jgi:hypothetical protein
MTAYKAARHRPHHATTDLAPLSALCLTIPDRRPSTPGARLVPGASPVTSQREGEYKWAQQQPRRHAVAAHCCQRGRRRQRRRRQRCLRRDLLAAVCGRLALSGRGGERRSVRDAAPFVTRATFSLGANFVRQDKPVDSQRSRFYYRATVSYCVTFGRVESSTIVSSRKSSQTQQFTPSSTCDQPCAPVATRKVRRCHPPPCRPSRDPARAARSAA